jgi:hypothetical protein
MLEQSSGELLSSLLVQLVSKRVIESPSVVVGLVVPVWKAVALETARLSTDSSTVSLPSTHSTPPLRIVNDLANLLLLPSLQSNHASSQSLTLEDIHRFQASSAACYESSFSFLALVTHLPYLVVLETLLSASDPLSTSTKALRERLSSQGTLKTAVFRHQDEVKDAFLRFDWRGQGPGSTDGKSKGEVETGLHARMIEALKEIVSERGPGTWRNHPLCSSPSIGPESDHINQSVFPSPVEPTHSPSAYDWRKVVSNLTPWRWARTVLELQLSLKQLAIRLASDSSAVEAENLLRNLTRTVFERNLSADETDLVSEALRGNEAAPIEKVCSFLTLNVPVCPDRSSKMLTSNVRSTPFMSVYQFVAAGMNRIVDILASFDLDDTISTPDRIQPAFDNISNVLRILASALSQSRPSPRASISSSPKPSAPTPPAPSSAAKSTIPPSPTSIVQDRFVDEVLRHLQQLEIRLEAASASWNNVLRKVEKTKEEEMPRMRTYLVVLLRVLHVNLGLDRFGMGEVWSTKANSALDPLIQLLFRFIVVSRAFLLLSVRQLG